MQYDEYLKEQERFAKERKIENQKREQEYLARIKKEIPHEGMNEAYIDYRLYSLNQNHRA